MLKFFASLLPTCTQGSCGSGKTCYDNNVCACSACLSPAQYTQMDVNKDGKVTLTDPFLLQRIKLGMLRFAEDLTVSDSGNCAISIEVSIFDENNAPVTKFLSEDGQTVLNTVHFEYLGSLPFLATEMKQSGRSAATLKGPFLEGCLIPLVHFGSRCRY